MSTAPHTHTKLPFETLQATVTAAYAKRLGCHSDDPLVRADRFLRWCLDELAETYDPGSSESDETIGHAIDALDAVIDDVTAMIVALHRLDVAPQTRPSVSE